MAELRSDDLRSHPLAVDRQWSVAWRGAW